MRLILIIVSFIHFTFLYAGQTPYKIETLLQQKDVIWGFDFLSKDILLFNERGGKSLAMT